MGAPGTFFGFFQWCQGMFLKVPERFQRKKYSSCPETRLLPNMTAYFEIDKIMINGIDQEYGSLVWLQNKSDSHYSGESNSSKEQTYQLYRKISSEEIYNLEMDQVPGFKIKWHHRQPKAIIPANMSDSFDFKR